MAFIIYAFGCATTRPVNNNAIKKHLEKTVIYDVQWGDMKARQYNAKKEALAKRKMYSGFAEKVANAPGTRR